MPRDKQRLLKLSLLGVGWALAWAGSTALAQQPVQPLPKVGPCPLGYYSSGSYCLSSPSNNRQAIPKQGSGCPLGWFSSGSYCLQSR